MISFDNHNMEHTHGINITPLIDVVFILLIFFLLTAKTSSGIVLDLPEATSAENIPLESWEIAIAKDETLLFNGVGVKKDHLQNILATAKNQHRSQRLVVLKAHKDASVNSFVSVMDIIRKTGFYNLVIATHIKQDAR